jgi:hypothetical protein
MLSSACCGASSARKMSRSVSAVSNDGLQLVDSARRKAVRYIVATSSTESSGSHVVNGPRTPVHMDLLCGRQQVLRSIYGASAWLLGAGHRLDRHVAPENPSSEQVFVN